MGSERKFQNAVHAYRTRKKVPARWNFSQPCSWSPSAGSRTTHLTAMQSRRSAAAGPADSLGGAALGSGRRHRRPADLAERLEQLLRERVVERLVFGMPLHADDEARAGQAHRLDLAIGRDRLDPQTRRELVDPLPVQR